MEGTTTAMSGIATGLQSALNTDAMLTNLGVLIPVIGGVVVFAFTYRIIKKVVSGASRAKARM